MIASIIFHVCRSILTRSKCREAEKSMGNANACPVIRRLRDISVPMTGAEFHAYKVKRRVSFIRQDFEAFVNVPKDALDLHSIVVFTRDGVRIRSLSRSTTCSNTPKKALALSRTTVWKMPK